MVPNPSGMSIRNVYYTLSLVSDKSNAAVAELTKRQLRDVEATYDRFEERVRRGWTFGGGMSGHGQRDLERGAREAGERAGRAFARGMSTGVGGGAAAGAGGDFAEATFKRMSEDLFGDAKRRIATIEAARAGGAGAAGRAGAAGAVGGGGILGGAGMALGLAAGGLLAVQATRESHGAPGRLNETTGSALLSIPRAYDWAVTGIGRFFGAIGEDEYAVDVMGRGPYERQLQRESLRQRSRQEQARWSSQIYRHELAQSGVRSSGELQIGALTGDYSEFFASRASRMDAIQAFRGLTGNESPEDATHIAQKAVQAMEAEHRVRQQLLGSLEGEVARLRDLQQAGMTFKEAWLAADPYTRSLMERGERGQFDGMAPWEYQTAGRWAMTPEAQAARDRYVDERFKTEGGALSPEFSRRISDQSGRAEEMRRQLEEAMGQALQPLNQIMRDGGDAIGRKVAESLVEGIRLMTEASQEQIERAVREMENRLHAEVMRINARGDVRRAQGWMGGAE